MEKPKKIESNYMRRVKPKKAKPDKFNQKAREIRRTVEDLQEKRRLEQDLNFLW